MKKEIVDIDKKQGIFRITTQDERWYAIRETKRSTGLPTYNFVPSVTWIASHYPKGIGFYKWLANTGWDEAEANKQAAGDKGSRVHKAIEDLISGKKVDMDSIYDGKNGTQELSVEEYEALYSFMNWANGVKPRFLHKEILAISKKYDFAGTVDCVAEIGDDTYIIDWKTSKEVWPEYEIQLSAYRQALIEMKLVDENVKLAILQVGYPRNKNGWKWNPLQDQFSLFLSARSIWEFEVGRKKDGGKPRQIDLPMSLQLEYLNNAKD